MFHACSVVKRVTLILNICSVVTLVTLVLHACSVVTLVTLMIHACSLVTLVTIMLRACSVITLVTLMLRACSVVTLVTLMLHGCVCVSGGTAAGTEQAAQISSLDHVMSLCKITPVSDNVLSARLARLDMCVSQSVFNYLAALHHGYHSFCCLLLGKNPVFLARFG